MLQSINNSCNDWNSTTTRPDECWPQLLKAMSTHQLKLQDFQVRWNETAQVIYCTSAGYLIHILSSYVILVMWYRTSPVTIVWDMAIWHLIINTDNKMHQVEINTTLSSSSLMQEIAANYQTIYKFYTSSHEIRGQLQFKMIFLIQALNQWCLWWPDIFVLTK